VRAGAGSSQLRKIRSGRPEGQNDSPLARNLAGMKTGNTGNLNACSNPDDPKQLSRKLAREF